MTRRLAINDEYPARPVDEYQVAPHRYRYDGDDSYRDCKSLRDFFASVPYQRGEVVFVAEGDKAVRAIIMSVNAYRNRWGERRESFRVLLETKRGVWSKAWRRTYPGPIQRGYAIAGRAPDVPL